MGNRGLNWLEGRLREGEVGFGWAGVGAWGGLGFEFGTNWGKKVGRFFLGALKF